ncbi:hypothetical protein VNO78_16511 [Psophocarpus tetragonolobus]|uniref:Uncharacterized protein n=1 Tax=Psophocarpus tetragonolobus TaxID=3891 RepID=A0AAN9XKQ2_PSOTE
MFREAMHHRQARENAIYRGLTLINESIHRFTMRQSTSPIQFAELVNWPPFAIQFSLSPIHPKAPGSPSIALSRSTDANKGKGTMIEDPDNQMDMGTLAALSAVFGDDRDF